MFYYVYDNRIIVNSSKQPNDMTEISHVRFQEKLVLCEISKQGVNRIIPCTLHIYQLGVPAKLPQYHYSTGVYMIQSYLYKSYPNRLVCNKEDIDIGNSQGSLYKFRQYTVPLVHIHQYLQGNGKHGRMEWRQIGNQTTADI